MDRYENFIYDDIMYHQPNTGITFIQAMNTVLNSSSMVGVVSSVIMWEITERYHIQGYRRVMLIGASVYFTNVVQLWTEENGMLNKV